MTHEPPAHLDEPARGKWSEVSPILEERGDIDEQKHAVMLELLRDLSRLPEVNRLVHADHLSEGGLCELIEHLYGERGRLGEEAFLAANRRVRQALRKLLDQDLKVAGKAEG